MGKCNCMSTNIKAYEVTSITGIDGIRGTEVRKPAPGPVQVHSARLTNTRLMAAGYSTGFGRSVSSQPSCRRELGDPIDREVCQPR
jgi:hypothetical protein